MAASFDEYSRKKIAAAQAANLAGFESVEVPSETPPGEVAIGNDWTRTLFDGWFYRAQPDDRSGLPAVSLVFVQSADGNTVADDPSTLGGGETDKHLVYEGLARVDADAVLSGAATASHGGVFSVWHPELVRLRRERGRTRHPAQVVLTNRAELPVDRTLYNEPSLRVIVITSRSGASSVAPRVAARPWIEIIDAGESVDVRRALRELRARGIETISAIGGRETASALVQAGAVADLYLTTAAAPGGEPGTPLFNGVMPPHHVLLRKRGRDGERGVRFEHLIFNR